jgi:regulator of cell morphogenesis and NO signaling
VHTIKKNTDNHLFKEEQVLFPAVIKGMRQMLNGPIAIMASEFEELGGMLRRMRELTNDYVIHV